MRKRLTALLCAAVLLVQGLMLSAGAASGGLFFLSVNDTLPASSAQTTPIQYNGWIYVPANIFSSKTTGVNIGVYYGFSDSNTLTLYNLSGKRVSFDIAEGTAAAVGSKPPVPGKVVRQNGVYYVPAYAVCQYFGLTYSYLSTDYGPLLRIVNENAVLNDRVFVSSAASMMRARLNEYQREQAASGGTAAAPSVETPATQPVTPPVVQGTAPSTASKPSGGVSVPAVTAPAAGGQAAAPQPEAVPVPTFSLTVGLRASTAGNLSQLLDVLSQRSVRAVVFFPADRVGDYADGLRQTVGQGNRIGLIPVGDTPEQRLASLRSGEAVVARLVRQEVWFVLNAEENAVKAGYLSWLPGMTITEGAATDTLYNGIVSKGAGRDAALRLLVGDTVPAAALSAVLAKLSNDGDTFPVPRETSY